jgi:hypothetical protein
LIFTPDLLLNITHGRVDIHADLAAEDNAWPT